MSAPPSENSRHCRMVFGKRGTSSFRPLVSVCAIWGRRERARLIASNVKRVSEAEAAQGFGCFFQPVFTIRGRAEARQPSVPSVTNVWCTCFCFYSSQKNKQKKLLQISLLFLSSASSKKGPAGRTNQLLKFTVNKPVFMFSIIG